MSVTTESLISMGERTSLFLGQTGQSSYDREIEGVNIPIYRPLSVN